MSVQKRRREQAARERQQLKAEKRAQRKIEKPEEPQEEAVIQEGVPAE